MQLSALLHDADDKKYFQTDKSKANAVNIVKSAMKHYKGFDQDTILEEVLEMISYVSASDNGNTVPKRSKKNPEFLWPRYSDRLEAIGPIGAVRCWQYNEEVKRPKAVATTPRPKKREELWSMVTPNRFDKYM